MEKVDIFETASNNFLELSSIQRLQILNKLQEKKSKPSELVKEFDSTRQEVYRNFSRLEDGYLIQKDFEGFYSLTEFGETICSQIPSIVFLSQNMEYFKTHNFGNMPKKFKMRIGQLSKSEQIKGLGNVLENWKKVCSEAKEFIYIATSEVIMDLERSLLSKLKEEIPISYLLSSTCILPDGREQFLKEMKIDNFIQKGTIERRSRKTVSTAVLVTEKDAIISFPNIEGEPDFSKVFYGSDKDFHEWALDFFRYYWNDSSSYNENLMKKPLN
ncbi:MAG: transcriptional regulator [Nitrosopumilaceae archaeon]|nr:transcriptional regulator [Nitrosopumilaceae archaeon]